MLTIEVFLATMSALVVAATAVLLWILSEFRAMRKDIQAVRDDNREDNRRTREELREEIQKSREESKAENQRVLESLYFHRHNQEGAAAFYPPAPRSSINLCGLVDDL